MISEWARETLDIARLRADVWRMRRSDLARDQFRDGYKAGYSVGRREEGAGAPDSIGDLNYGGHPQTSVRGIDVDEGMAGLLVAVWDFGLDTQFSCQGDPDKCVPGASENSWTSQIVFSDIDQAYEFMRATLVDLPMLKYSEASLTLSSMTPIYPDVKARAAVTFSPRVLNLVTAIWQQKVATSR